MTEEAKEFHKTVWPGLALVIIASALLFALQRVVQNGSSELDAFLPLLGIVQVLVVLMWGGVALVLISHSLERFFRRIFSTSRSGKGPRPS